jgi:hypothetical protein
MGWCDTTMSPTRKATFLRKEGLKFVKCGKLKTMFNHL